MFLLPFILIRQPQPFDIVDDPLKICGIATAFEGKVQARVRDNNGTELLQQSFMSSGTGIWANFSAKLSFGLIPTTTMGTLEVFELSAQDGSEVNKVIIPIIFGRTLIPNYIGFTQYTVVSGDTLFKIAQRFYGDGALSSRIFEANRPQLTNPDRIFVGQVLRIPQ